MILTLAWNKHICILPELLTEHDVCGLELSDMRVNIKLIWAFVGMWIKFNCNIDE